MHVIHEFQRLGSRIQRTHEVAQVDDTGDVVEVRTIHGKDVGWAARDGCHERCGVGLGRKRYQLGPGHHDMRCGQVGEPEYAMQHLFFLLLDDAGFLAGCHQHLELFFRVHH